ncbi:MAG: aspartate aminotransferase family protein [Armatimonadetes bacterium]|nr:aspartate aminotransferase family protein [Armatimonadota bacterium]
MQTDVTLDRWEQEALDHVWVHASHWVELAERRGLRVFVEGKGCILIDSHGDRYLDGLSGLWVVNVGHGRTEIAEAMAKQAARLAYVSAGAFTTTPAVELAEVLARITPGDLSRVFFCSGGSEAVESAVKIVKQAQALRGFPRRYKIIARRGSYHGATFGAMSVAGLRREQEPHFGPFMYGVTHIPSPNRYRNDFGLEGEEGDLMCARFLEQEIEFQGPETVAAFIGEPVSTSNGNHVPSPRYWQMVREICDRHGVLLIMDEVINGFGRTGRMFAAEHFGVVPDIMTVAKGLSSGYAPIAAAIVRPGVFEPFQPEGRRLGHLLTFGGQAVACAAALKNVEIMQREGLPQRAAEMGGYLLEGLRTLMDHPTVGDVRGIGLMCGIELVKDKGTKERWERDGEFLAYLGEKIMERRLIVRAWQVLHVAPPLVVTKEEIDRIASILDECLTLAERKFGLSG